MSGAVLSWTDAPDSAILDGLLALFCRVPTPRILDVTANQGAIWRASRHLPAVFVDLDPTQLPDVCADCRALPFAAGTFDVVVFDPPHLPGGQRHTLPGYNRRYGLGTVPSNHYGAIPALFAPFLVEAARVLRPDGLVLAKLSNPVSWDQRRWYVHQFWAAAEATPGLRYEDEQIKVRDVPMPQDGRAAQHLRAAHSVWCVVRRVRL